MLIRRPKHWVMWGISGVVGSVLVLMGYFALYRLLHMPVVSVAVVAPSSGPYALSGQEMLKGIQVYLEKARREKLLPQRRIAVRTYDDANDPQQAEAIALEIANNTATVLVIGHFSEETSAAAGQVYKKFRLPAITASSASEEITSGNEWYFRIFQNTSFQAGFIANYVKYVFHRPVVSVIFENSLYGQSLARAFEQSARSIGLDISIKAPLYPERTNFDAQIAMLVKRIRTAEDPGIIVLAMRHPTAIPLITALQSPAHRYTLIGPDTFTTTPMQNALKHVADEHQHPPGYYSDGMYALAPFMIDTGNHQAQVFKDEYERMFPGESPSWVAAHYYDAMAVAVRAIAQARLEGAGHLRGDRQSIRETLIGSYDEKTAVRGVTGNIFFNSSRDTANPPIMSVFHQQRLLPAFTQYQTDRRTYDNPFERVLRGELMVINQHRLLQTRVVYTDFRINHISDIDSKNPRYTIDFYLWFRFQQGFDDANIVFANAVSPIVLGEPVIEHTSAELTTHVYHVVAEFTQNFDFQAYPFDEQVLSIAFQHASLPQEQLIYVADPFGLPEAVRQRIDETAPLTHDIWGWKIARIRTSQDVISHLSSLGNPDYFEDEHSIDASQFRINIRITRSDISFYVRAFFPMIVLLLLSGSVFTVFSVDQLKMRLWVLMTVLGLTAFYHIYSLIELPEEYVLPGDYAYFAIYGLLTLAMYVSVSGYAFYRRRLELVQEMYLFHSFSDKMKAQICKRMRRRRYKKPDRILIAQGDEGDSLFLMIQGEARAWIRLDDGSSLEVNHFTTGDFFGEMALLTGGKRSAYVATTTPAFVGEIAKADIAPFLVRNPELITTLSAELVRRKIHELERRGDQSAALIDVKEMSDAYSSSIRQFFDM